MSDDKRESDKPIKLTPEELAAIAKARAEREAERAALVEPKGRPLVALLRPATDADIESEPIKAWMRRAPPEMVDEWLAERGAAIAQTRLQQADEHDEAKRQLERSAPELARAAEKKRAKSGKRFVAANWSIWEALAWIAYRDPERLIEISSRSDWIAARQFPRHSPMKEGDPAALLIDALERGEIIATKDGKPIPPAAWAFKKPWEITGAALERVAIMAIWPRDNAVSGRDDANGPIEAVPTPTNEEAVGSAVAEEVLLVPLKRGGGRKHGPWFKEAVKRLSQAARNDQTFVERMSADDLVAYLKKYVSTVPKDKRTAIKGCLKARDEALGMLVGRQ